MTLGDFEITSNDVANGTFWALFALCFAYMIYLFGKQAVRVFRGVLT